MLWNAFTPRSFIVCSFLLFFSVLEVLILLQISEINLQKSFYKFVLQDFILFIYLNGSVRFWIMCYEENLPLSEKVDVIHETTNPLFR